MNAPSPVDAPDAASAPKRAFAGAVWAGLGRWGGSALSVATLAVTARLLGPAPFGLYALATATTALGDLLVSGVLIEALTQRKRLSEAERRAGFWISTPLAIALYLLYALVAPHFRADIGPLLPWCALGMPISACAAAPVQLLMRDMRFKALTTVELIASAVSSLIGIGLALTHHGVFSLIVMELTRASLRCVGVYLATGYRPGLPPPLTAIISVLKFGAGGLGVALLSLADRQIPRIVIGVWLGAPALGVFSLAMKLFDTFSQLVLGPFGAVAMSVVARMQDDRPALQKMVAGTLRLTAAAAGPGYLGLAAVAPVLIPTAFGASWVEAIAPTQVLLLMGLRNSASAFNVAILRGVGWSRAPLVTMGVGAAMTAILVPLAAPFGLIAVTFAMLARNLATWPLAASYLAQAIGLSVKSQAAAGGPPLAAAIGMAIVVNLFVVRVGASFGAWPTLGVAAGIGVVVYGLALALIDPTTLKELIATAARIVRLPVGRPF